jgi:signal peptidase I
LAKFKLKNKNYSSQENQKNNIQKNNLKNNLKNILKNKTKNVFSFIFKKLSFLKWIDPFTYVDIFVIPRVEKFGPTVVSIVNVLFALFFALAIYVILGLLLNTQNPVMIVYSGSMIPTLNRGDVVFLSGGEINAPIVKLNSEVLSISSISSIPTKMYSSRIPVSPSQELFALKFGETILPYTKTGDIVVYASSIAGKDIIHRAIVLIEAPDGKFIFTKGDNSNTNATFDQDCFDMEYGRRINCFYESALPVSEVKGKVVFVVPLVGCVKIWLMDNLPSILATGKLPRDFAGVC